MDNAYENLAVIGKAIAHPARLRMIEVLAVEEACVCHLTQILGKRQAYVSQQLSVLRDAGLVDMRREGQMIYYRLTDSRVAGVLSLMQDVARQQDDALVFAPVPRSPLPGCHCPHCEGGAASCCDDDSVV